MAPFVTANAGLGVCPRAVVGGLVEHCVDSRDDMRVASLFKNNACELDRDLPGHGRAAPVWKQLDAPTVTVRPTILARALVLAASGLR